MNRLYYRNQNKISNNISKLLILYYIAVVQLFIYTDFNDNKCYPHIFLF